MEAQAKSSAASPCEGEQRRPTRVLVNALRILLGGVTVYRDELIAGLQAREGIELVVACRAEWAEELREAGVDVRPIAMASPPLDKLQERRRLIELCRELRPDILHTPATLFLPPVDCIVVATVHDLSYRELDYGLVTRLYRHHSLASMCRRAARLICVSERTRDDLVQALPAVAGKAEVVCNGFRGPGDLPPLDEVAETTEPYLLTFAHWPHKNPAAAVRVLALLAEEHRGMELRIIGSDPQALAGVRRAAAELGVEPRVKLLGRVSDEELWSQYTGAAALIFLSEYEGSGLPVLEAMAVGCPVVVSDRGALPGTAGGHGAVVALDDVEAAARYVDRHLAEPVWSLEQRRAARAYVSDFSWERTVDHTVAIYERLLAPNTASEHDPLSWVDPSWGWPPAILEMLGELAQAFALPEVKSAILTGSTARGELAVEQSEGEVMLRSDVELYVVADDPGGAQAALAAPIRELERRYGELWSSFHVDVAYMRPSRLPALEPWIRHCELHANARVLAGEDLRPLLPAFDVDQLDWCELNEVALWRSMSLVLQLPLDWLAGARPLNVEERHLLARNLLDVTTWAWPGAGRILPSFGARVEAWRTDGPPAELAGLELPDAELLGACLAARADSARLPDGELLFSAAVRAWRSIWSVVEGELPCGHRAAGAGVRRLDILRRTRAAVRLLPLGATASVVTLQRGPFEPAARCALQLAATALDLRAGADTTGTLEEQRRLLGVSTGGSALELWRDLRLQLGRYMDLALARPHWERLVPPENHGC